MRLRMQTLDHQSCEIDSAAVGATLLLASVDADATLLFAPADTDIVEEVDCATDNAETELDKANPPSTLNGKYLESEVESQGCCSAVVFVFGPSKASFQFDQESFDSFVDV